MSFRTVNCTAMTKDADYVSAPTGTNGTVVGTERAKHLTAAVAYPILGLRPIGSFGFCVVYWELYPLSCPFLIADFDESNRGACAFPKIGEDMKDLKVGFADADSYSKILFDLIHPEGLPCPRCNEPNGLHMFRRHPNSWIVDYRCSHCWRIFNPWKRTPLDIP